MSIFSCLSKAESTLQTALKNEWNAIPQASKDEITAILEATNVLKADGSLDGPTIVADIEKVTGTAVVTSLLSVVDKVAASLGIDVPAGTSPTDTFALIAKSISGLTGNSWEDKVLAISVYFVTNLVGGGVIARTIAIPLVQWIYDNVITKPAAAAAVATT